MRSCMGGEDGAVIGGESGKKFEFMTAAAASSMIASVFSKNVDVCCEVFIGERKRFEFGGEGKEPDELSQSKSCGDGGAVLE